MNADQIEEIVGKLMELKKTKTVAEIDQISEFNEFRTSQKMLYHTVLSDDMDLSIFRQMMAMKRRIEGGDDRYSVDVRFGQFMADKYIEPVVSKLN